jgi:hypothetical protein
LGFEATQFVTAKGELPLKNKLFILSLLIVGLLAFVSYQYVLPASPSEDGSHLFEVNQINQVTVSASQEFGSVHPVTLRTFSDKDAIQVFAEAIQSAKKIDGKMDVRHPDYDFNLLFSNQTNEGYHLWLGDTSGMIMHITDTHFGYNLTESSVKALHSLIHQDVASSVQTDGDLRFGGVMNQPYITSWLRPGNVYTTDYPKNGGYHGDGPNAEFYKQFYQERDSVKLPPGEYKVIVIADFEWIETEWQEIDEIKYNFPSELTFRVIKD